MSNNPALKFRTDSSVISIGDDELCEEMRQHYSHKHGLPYEKIEKKGNNYYRSQRITAYLDLVQDLVDQDFNALRQAPFEPGSESTKYFEREMTVFLGNNSISWNFQIVNWTIAIKHS